MEKDNLAITESFFKDAISRVILFRHTERLVTKAPWYDGGFRAQTVAYSVAYLSSWVDKNRLSLNFNLIWEQQDLPGQLVEMLELIAEAVYSKITHPPSGYANITQWTKNAGCWESVKGIDIKLPELSPVLFIDSEEKKYQEKDNRETKTVDKNILSQIFVLEVAKEEWRKLFVYYGSYKGSARLSSMQLDMLDKIASGRIPFPSEKQSKILYQIYVDAKKEGVDLAK